MEISTIMIFTHVLSYWTIASIFTLFDLIIYNNLPFSKLIKPYKIGKVDKKYIDYTKSSLINSIKNQCIVTIPSIYAVSFYIISDITVPCYIHECLKLLFYIITGDVWFYTFHRILHEIPLLYKIHKYHHRLSTTCALAALDSDLIEHALIISSTLLGPYLWSPYYITIYLWIFITTMNVINSHSGFLFFDTKHNIHHKLLKYNYGNGFYLMDTLFGTINEPRANFPSHNNPV